MTGYERIAEVPGVALQRAENDPQQPYLRLLIFGRDTCISELTPHLLKRINKCIADKGKVSDAKSRASLMLTAL